MSLNFPLTSLTSLNFPTYERKNEQIMIEDRSYGKAELAMLYFPTATPRVALNRLVRWINRCPELKQSLCSGCAGKFSHFYTRQQVAEIIEFLPQFGIRNSA